MAFFAHVCSEASLPKKAKGDPCFSRVYTANRMLQAAILPLSIARERFPVSHICLCTVHSTFQSSVEDTAEIQICAVRPQRNVC